eukprot:scaffold68149_cov26-Prasinocladus_malaysianus.AAC.1
MGTTKYEYSYEYWYDNELTISRANSVSALSVAAKRVPLAHTGRVSLSARSYYFTFENKL